MFYVTAVNHLLVLCILSQPVHLFQASAELIKTSKSTNKWREPRVRLNFLYNLGKNFSSRHYILLCKVIFENSCRHNITLCNKSSK